MLRSCAGSLDEATTFWLNNDRPFDLAAWSIWSWNSSTHRCSALHGWPRT